MSIMHRHKPSAATAAVVTIPAITGVRHQIESLEWSYSATPTGGNLKIESPSGTVLKEIDITADGPGFLPFSGSCIQGAVDQAVIITLASGAGAVQGILNVNQRG